MQVAKDNLQRIKQHYEYYRLLKDSLWMRSTKNQASLIKEFGTKDWFVAGYDFSLILKSDDGRSCQIAAPWCGYAARLKSVEIEYNDSDMKITF